MFSAAPAGTVTSSGPPVPEAVTQGYRGTARRAGPAPRLALKAASLTRAREGGSRTIKFVVVIFG